ncbi:MAG: hypothetical protein DCC49_13685 [Acidobacteria bacterium]|nr:MAG: hypothetical protein DCC49_13685 [Acidobacteriota bacterium]
MMNPAQPRRARLSGPRDSRRRSYSHRAPAPTSTFANLPLRPVRDTLVADEDMTGTVREYLYAGGEAPTAMRSRNSDGSYSNFFFVTNTHGDVVALTDKDGNIVNRYAYGPWGEATRVSESVHQPFRYAGYRYEDGFGLYYLRARWYDAGTGRFLSRDGFGQDLAIVASLNKYVYGEANPQLYDDPTGRSVRKATCRTLVLPATGLPFECLQTTSPSSTDEPTLPAGRGRDLQECYSSVELGWESMTEAIIRLKYSCTGSFPSASSNQANVYRYSVDLLKRRIFQHFWSTAVRNITKDQMVVYGGENPPTNELFELARFDLGGRRGTFKFLVHLSRRWPGATTRAFEIPSYEFSCNSNRCGITP